MPRFPPGRRAGSWCWPNAPIPGWSAWLDGRRLTATTSGWAQAFTLPAQGGQLSLRYEAPWAIWAGVAQAVIIGLTALLAIPMPARRPNTGLSRDEGSLRKEHHHAQG